MCFQNILFDQIFHLVIKIEIHIIVNYLNYISYKVVFHFVIILLAICHYDIMFGHLINHIYCICYYCYPEKC